MSRRTILIVLLIVLLAAAAAGGAVVLKLKVFSSSGGAASAQADTTESEEPPLDLPVASATDQLVASMTLDQKIGQMMMVGFDGSQPDATITESIQKRQIGGVILYARNIVSHEQVAGMNAALQKLAAEANQPAKLMIAIDQEGGKSRRFEDLGPYYSQPFVGEMHDTAPAVAQQQASVTARELKPLGINVNLAPVADVSAGWGTIMDGRSYGYDAAFDAEIAAAAVKSYNGANFICSPKHFPGHGAADGDSDTVLPTVDSDRETLEGKDLLPFAAVIKENAPMIMVGHLVVPALDPSETPASMSPMIINDLLKGIMGFKGVVITDDLDLAAITSTYKVSDAAVAAVAAGADIVMVAQTAASQQEVFDALKAAVTSGRLHQADIDRSVGKILDMKQKYRLEK